MEYVEQKCFCCDHTRRIPASKLQSRYVCRECKTLHKDTQKDAEEYVALSKAIMKEHYGK